MDTAIEQLAVLGLVLIAATLAWVAFQIRKLHRDLEPVINSAIVQTLSRV